MPNQVLPTQWKKVHIDKQGGTTAYRMCNGIEEYVSHTFRECEKVAQTEYKQKAQQSDTTYQLELQKI